MDELTINRTFVRVVERGSLSAASRALNMSITTVARQINTLEAMLGVRLLHRTTRRQSLTEAGQLYYADLTDVLKRMDEIKRNVAAYQDGVKGRLRVHLRSSIGNQVIVPALPRFLEQYPDLDLDVTLTDERVDLVEQGVELAVWLGKLDDSTMIARRLSPGRRLLVASPAYLERHGQPRTPDDLVEHNCLVFDVVNYGSPWRFTRDGDTQEIEIRGNVKTVSGAVLMTSALNGLGLVMLQEVMVKNAIDEGKLVRVLTDYEVSPTSLDTALYLVYPSSRLLSSKTRAFADFLIDLFKHLQ